MSQNTKTISLALRDIRGIISTINQSKKYASNQINILYWNICEYKKSYNKTDDTREILECYSDYIDIILKYLDTLNLKSHKEYKSTITKYMGAIDDIHLISPLITNSMVDVTTKILECVTDPSIKAPCAKELIRAYNNILKNCDKSVKEKLVDSGIGFYLLKLVDILCSCGDFEYQTILLETIFRIGPNTFIKSYAADFFPEAENLQAALIKFDVKHFDSSRRIFLNTVNRASGGVFSFVAQNILLDEINVEPPVDAYGNRQQLWIDFNKIAETIGIFCEQSCLKTDMLSQDDDESGWELITIFVSDVGLVETKKSTIKNRTTVLFKFTLTTPFYVKYPGSEAITKSKFLKVVTADSKVVQELQEIVLPCIFKNKFQNTRKPKNKSRISVHSLPRKDSFKGIYKPLKMRVKSSVRSRSITSADTRSIKSLDDVLNVRPEINGIKSVDISSDNPNCDLDTQYFSVQENSESIIEETPKRGNLLDISVQKSGDKTKEGRSWDKFKIKMPFIRKCILTKKIALDPGVSPILETSEISHTRKSQQLTESEQNEINKKPSENVSSEVEICSQISVLSSQCSKKQKRGRPPGRKSFQYNHIQNSMELDTESIKQVKRTCTRKGNRINNNVREETRSNNKSEVKCDDFLCDTMSAIEEGIHNSRSNEHLTQENCNDVVNSDDNPIEASITNKAIILEDDQYFTAPLELEISVKEHVELEKQGELLKPITIISEAIGNKEKNKEDIGKELTVTQNEIVVSQKLNRALKNTSGNDIGRSAIAANPRVRVDKVVGRYRKKETRSIKDKGSKIFNSYTSSTSESDNSELIKNDLEQTIVRSQHSILEEAKVDAPHANSSQQNLSQTNKNSFTNNDIATSPPDLVIPSVRVRENKVTRQSTDNKGNSQKDKKSKVSSSTFTTPEGINSKKNNIYSEEMKEPSVNMEHLTLSKHILRSEKPNKHTYFGKKYSKFKEPPKRNKYRESKRQSDKRLSMSSSSSSLTEHTNSKAKQDCLEQVNDNVDNTIESDDDSTFVDESLLNENNEEVNEPKKVEEVTGFVHGTHVNDQHCQSIKDVSVLPIVNKQISASENTVQQIIDLTQSDDDEAPENINSADDLINMQSESLVKRVVYAESDISSQIISGNNTFAVKQSKKLKSQILRRSQTATAKKVLNIDPSSEMNKMVIQDEIIESNQDNKVSDDDNVVCSKDKNQNLETNTDLFIETQNSLFDQFVQDSITADRDNKVRSNNVETIIEKPASTDNPKGEIVESFRATPALNRADSFLILSSEDTRLNHPHRAFQCDPHNENLSDQESSRIKPLEDNLTKLPDSSGHPDTHTSEARMFHSPKKTEKVNNVEESGSKLEELETKKPSLIPNKDEPRQLRRRKLNHVQSLEEKILNAAAENAIAFEDKAGTSKILPNTRGRKNKKNISKIVETKIKERENTNGEVAGENVAVEFALNRADLLQRFSNKGEVEKLYGSDNENLNNQEEQRNSYIKPIQETSKPHDNSEDSNAKIPEDDGSHFRQNIEGNVIKESGSQKKEFETLIAKDNQRRLRRRTLYNIQPLDENTRNAGEATREFVNQTETSKLLPKTRERKKKQPKNVLTPKKLENVTEGRLHNNTLENSTFNGIYCPPQFQSSAFSNFIAETDIASDREDPSELQDVHQDINNNSRTLENKTDKENLNPENNATINVTKSSKNRIKKRNGTQEPKNDEHLEKLEPLNNHTLLDVNTERVISHSQRSRSSDLKRKLSQSDTPLFVKPSETKRYKLFDPNDFTYLEEDQTSCFVRESPNNARETTIKSKDVSVKSRSISKKKEKKPRSSKSKLSMAKKKNRNHRRKTDSTDTDIARANTRQRELFDTFLCSFVEDFNKSQVKRIGKKIPSNKNIRKRSINTSSDFDVNSEKKTEIWPSKVKILENIVIQPASHKENRRDEVKETDKENCEEMWPAMLKIFDTINVARNEMLDVLIKYAPHGIKDGPKYSALLEKQQHY